MVFGGPSGYVVTAWDLVGLEEEDSIVRRENFCLVTSLFSSEVHAAEFCPASPSICACLADSGLFFWHLTAHVDRNTLTCVPAEFKPNFDDIEDSNKKAVAEQELAKRGIMDDLQRKGVDISEVDPETGLVVPARSASKGFEFVRQFGEGFLDPSADAGLLAPFAIDTRTKDNIELVKTGDINDDDNSSNFDYHEHNEVWIARRRFTDFTWLPDMRHLLASNVAGEFIIFDCQTGYSTSNQGGNFSSRIISKHIEIDKNEYCWLKEDEHLLQTLLQGSFCTSVVLSENTLAAGCSDGRVRFLDAPEYSLRQMKWDSPKLKRVIGMTPSLPQRDAYGHVCFSAVTYMDSSPDYRKLYVSAEDGGTFSTLLDAKVAHAADAEHPSQLSGQRASSTQPEHARRGSIGRATGLASYEHAFAAAGYGVDGSCNEGLPIDDLMVSTVVDGHCGAVLACANVHPGPQSSKHQGLPSSLVATAGMDSTLRVWNCDTGKILCKRIFIDSVGEQSSSLYHFDGIQHPTVSPKVYPSSDFETEKSTVSLISSLASHSELPLLAVGSENGRLRLVLLSSNEYKDISSHDDSTAKLRSLDFASEREGVDPIQLSSSPEAPDVFATTVFSDWVHAGAVTNVAFNEVSNTPVIASFSAVDGTFVLFKLNEANSRAFDTDSPLATPVVVGRLPGYGTCPVPSSLSRLASDVVEAAETCGKKEDIPSNSKEKLVTMQFRRVSESNLGQLQTLKERSNNEEKMSFDVSTPDQGEGKLRRHDPPLDLQMIFSTGRVVSIPVPALDLFPSRFSRALEVVPDFSTFGRTVTAKLPADSPLAVCHWVGGSLLFCCHGDAPRLVSANSVASYGKERLSSEEPLDFVRVSEHPDKEFSRMGPKETMAVSSLRTYRSLQFDEDVAVDLTSENFIGDAPSNLITSASVHHHQGFVSVFLGDAYGNLHFAVTPSDQISASSMGQLEFKTIRVSSRPITSIEPTANFRYIVVCSGSCNFTCLKVEDKKLEINVDEVSSAHDEIHSFASRISDYVGPAASSGGVIGQLLALKASTPKEEEEGETDLEKHNLRVQIDGEGDLPEGPEDDENEEEDDDYLNWALSVCTDGEVEIEQLYSRVAPLGARWLATIAQNQQKLAESYRKDIRDKLNDIKSRLNKLLDANSEAPELERLDREEFLIDKAAEKIMDHEASKSIAEIKSTAENTIVEKNRIREQLITQLWNSMEAHFSTLHSFKGDVSVSNFPLPKMTDEEQRALNRATYLRRIEQTAMKQYHSDTATGKGLTEYGLLHSVAWLPLIQDFRNDTDWIFHAGLLPPSLDPRAQREMVDKLKQSFKQDNTTGQGKNAQHTFANENVGRHRAESSPSDDSSPTSAAKGFPEGNGCDFKETLYKSQKLAQEEDEEDQASAVGSTSTWTGSRIVKLLYHPASVRTPGQKRMQILFLNALLRSVQQEFNRKFDELWRMKSEEASRITKANERIREIYQELQSDEKVFEPDLSLDFVPGTMLEVTEEDVGFKPYVSEAELRRQREEEEMRRRQAEANKDDAPERALHDMMYGTLEKKDALAALEKELDNEFEPWMETLTEDQMNDAQKRAYTDYKAKLEEVQEQREVRKQSLEAELRKLTSEVKESRVAFDSKVSELKKSYLEFYESVVSQQLYAVRLAENVHERDTNVDLESRIVDQHISFDNMRAAASEVAENLEARINATRDELNKLHNFDKNLERSFKEAVREASTIHLDNEVMRILFHLYKHRQHYPELLDPKTRTIPAGSAEAILRILSIPREDIQADDQIGQSLVDVSRHPRDAPDAAWFNPIENVHDTTDAVEKASKILGYDVRKQDPFHKADLALIQNSAEGKIAEEEKNALAPVSARDLPVDWEIGTTIDHAVWQKFQDLREQKVSSELQLAGVKREISSLELDLKKQLQTCSRHGVAVEKLTNLFSDTLTAREMLGCDLILLTRMKQGIDEVQSDEPIPDYGNSCLVPRQVVELDNARIKFLSSIKVGILEQHRDYRQELSYLEWELKYLRGKCQDVAEYYTDLQLLRVTKTLQDYIRGGDIGDKQRRDLMKIDARGRQLQQSHERHIQKIKRWLSSIQAQCQAKQHENEKLLRQFKELKNSVRVREGIMQSRTAGRTEETDPTKLKEKKLNSVLRFRKLQDIVKYQREDIEVLEEELKRYRERTFPSFTELSETKSDQSVRSKAKPKSRGFSGSPLHSSKSGRTSITDEY